MNATSIRLTSGVEFDYANPSACQRITPHDIAHSLARLCRYVGQCANFWSVAQHDLLVVLLVRGFYREPRYTLGALHHDDVEAFTSDWPSPLKVFMREHGADYKVLLERPIEQAVCQHLGLALDDLHAGVVKDADKLAYVGESLALKAGFQADDQAAFDCSDVDMDVAGRVAGIVDRWTNTPLRMVEQRWRALHETAMAEWLTGQFPDPSELGMPWEDDS